VGEVLRRRGGRTDDMLDALSPLAYLSPYAVLLLALLALPAAVIPRGED
jgi:hypothetical protein